VSKTGVIAVIVISPLQFGQVSTFGTLESSIIDWIGERHGYELLPDRLG
jgi:hypothetical protein